MNEVRRFNGLIGPGNLLGLVRNTAPFLFADLPPEVQPGPGPVRLSELASHPLGWWRIVAAGTGFAYREEPTGSERVDYFALCFACHVATVATFIPTDVDAKIRGVLWDQRESPGNLRAMAELTLAASAWDTSSVSTRQIRVGGGRPVSGHDGEWLGVACGALGCFLALGDSAYAERLHAAVVAELERGADAFLRALRTPEAELDALRLSAVLTHNAGDVDQGLSFWRDDLHGHPYHQQLGLLAHENTAPFRSAYHIAATVYKRLMAPEGHRNYPLRTVKALRSSPDLLLPISPFLDGWGATIASHQALTLDDRAEVVAALLSGCKKIAGQLGYQRALAGIEEGLGGLDQLAKRLPGSIRSLLKDSELRRAVAVKRVSFESTMRKRCGAVLADARVRTR
jgi:hypothetical protein